MTAALTSDDYLAEAAALVWRAKRGDPGCRGVYAQHLLQEAAYLVTVANAHRRLFGESTP